MTRLWNFNAGPAALPLEVLQKAQADFVNYQGQGLSVMEMSHRSKAYEEIHFGAEQKLRSLLQLSDEYEVLFLQGGASLQFSMVPLNLLDEGDRAGYILSGAWSEKALEEAKKVGNIDVIASTQEYNYNRIPSLPPVLNTDDYKYVHITSNNTIFGTQWADLPKTTKPNLVIDASSDILSHPINMENVGMIYAGAQKNLGPSGVTLVIIRKDWISKDKKHLPAMLQYVTHSKTKSLYNTPPTFSIYMMYLTLQWIEDQGGLSAIQHLNASKANMLYNTMETSEGFYNIFAQEGSRSHMNVTFTLREDHLTKTFVKEAEQQGFIGLAGHRSVGGCRASIYNAVSFEACEALSQFMKKFQEQHDFTKVNK